MKPISPSMRGFLQFVGWYIPVAIVQWMSALSTVDALMTWYPMVRKPSWNPPDWVFGPVWTVLYLSMALAVWMISRAEAPPKEKRKAYGLFFAQLFLNGMWSYLFFGCFSIAGALIDLGLLVGFIGATIVAFYRIRKAAAVVLVPYLLWTVFAFALNVKIWLLN